MDTSTVSVRIPFATCPHCHQQMQLADAVTEGDVLISCRFICGCKLPEIVHANWHAGQTPSTR